MKVSAFARMLSMTKVKFVHAAIGGEIIYLLYKNGCVLYLKSSVHMYKHVCAHVCVYGNYSSLKKKILSHATTWMN